MASIEFVAGLRRTRGSPQYGMNTRKETAVTGEGNAPRDEINKGGFGYNEQTPFDTPARTIWPSFDDIQRMAGFPVDSEGYATADEAEDADNIRLTSDEDYANRSIGESADESEERDEEDEEDETPYRLSDEGRNSDGSGESYAERNA